MTGWKQLALDICDAQARHDLPGYLDALGRMIAAAEAAKAEVLAVEPEPTEASQ